MPQPFPKHLKEFMFNIGDAIQNRQTLSLMGMEVISQYVSLEVSLTNLFMTLLGANPGPAVAMLTAIKNNNIRNEAFRAVAESTLSGERLEILNAVLAMCETADKERNRIGHWVWATEKQLPDAVVLLDPRKVAIVQQKQRVLAEGKKPTAEEIIALMGELRGAALIYMADDFDAANSRVQQANISTITLTIFLRHPDGHPEGAKARKMLLDTPEIQQWLARQKNSNPPNNAQ
jgi:hypothetical protein